MYLKELNMASPSLFMDAFDYYFASQQNGHALDHHFTEIKYNSLTDSFEYHCYCQNYYATKTPCKHILACIIDYIHQNDPTTYALLESKYSAKAILSKALNYHSHASHQKVVLSQQVALTKRQDEYYVSFALGLDKLYSVNPVHGWMEAYHHQENLEFGKKFTYQPDLHKLSRPLQKTLAFLDELYDLQVLSHETYFDGKWVKIPKAYLIRFLKLWIGHNIVIESKTYEVTKEALPPVLDLSLNRGAIEVNLEVLKNQCIIYDQDNHIVLYDGLAYILSDEQRQILTPFIQASLSLESNIITFASEERMYFIDRLIPQLEKLQTIPENIQNLYRHGFLKAKLYLDKGHVGNILAKLEFTYGQYTFFPFGKVDAFLDKGRYVLRDFARETRITNILEKSEFQILNEHLTLEDEQAIQVFIFDYLPILQNMMEVYMSDDFKNIIKKRDFRPSIKMNYQTRFFDVDLGIENLKYEDFAKILESFSMGRHYYRLQDGAFLDLSNEDTKAILDMAIDLNVTKSTYHKGHLELPIYRAFYFSENFKDELSSDEAFNTFMDRFSEEYMESVEVPSNIHAKLRDYQVRGYGWLKMLGHFGLGGILADDMGLGKTLQTITYFQDHQLRHPESHHVVVCPSSLVFNWENEFHRFAPDLKVKIVTGNALLRAEILKNIEPYDVLITSYPLMRRDYELYKNYLFDTVVLDEAQYIKNPLSINASSVKQLKSKVRFALTGTPIENGLAELWSIFDFILPDYFSSLRHFRNKYDTSNMNEVEEAQLYQSLTRQIQPFLLRRLKKEVLKELPEKIETQIVVSMTPSQQQVYDAYYKETQWLISQMRKDHSFNTRQIELLSRLTHLRQLCDHPRLFNSSYDEQSGKVLALMEIVKESLDAGHTILIFSQFTSMLSIISEELQQLEIPHYYLDGQTPIASRNHMVNAFNAKKKPIFLISLKAGGTGLNLIGADTVIHVDPWWNPAVEDQATDRAYRIGQKKSVQVFSLVMKDSVEEKIQDLKAEKRHVVEAIIQPGETFLSHLSEDEIYRLFTEDTLES